MLAVATRSLVFLPSLRMIVPLASVIIGMTIVVAASSAIAGSSKCSKPPVVSRFSWSAKAAINNRMVRQVPRLIVIHHTGVQSHPHLPLEKKLRDLQRYSQRPGSEDGRPKRALGDIPYHFFIGFSGRIGEGRSLEFAGDTRTNYDTSDKIQIVLEGDFMTERPQAKQLEALEALLCWLRSEYSVPRAGIRTHQDVAATSCPGKNFLAVLPKLNLGD